MVIQNVRRRSVPTLYPLFHAPLNHRNIGFWQGVDGVTKTRGSVLANPTPDCLPSADTPKNIGYIGRARLFDEQKVVNLDDIFVQVAEESLLGDQQTGDFVPVVKLEPRSVELDHSAYAAVYRENGTFHITQVSTPAKEAQVKVVKSKAGVLPIPPARQLELADNDPRFEPEGRASRRHSNRSIRASPQEFGIGKRGPETPSLGAKIGLWEAERSVERCPAPGWCFLLCQSQSRKRVGWEVLTTAGCWYLQR